MCEMRICPKRKIRYCHDMKYILPLKPMSVNQAWRGGARYKTEEYKQFGQDVGILLGKVEKVGGFVDVKFVFYLTRTTYGLSDVDNLLKCILDAMVYNGCIDDDRKIVKITAEKRVAEDYRIEVEIKKSDVQFEDHPNQKYKNIKKHRLP